MYKFKKNSKIPELRGLYHHGPEIETDHGYFEYTERDFELIFNSGEMMFCSDAGSPIGELNTEQTKQLYEVMKEYYERV